MRLRMASTDSHLAFLVGTPLLVLPWVFFGLASWLPEQADVLASLGSVLVLTAASVWLFLRPTGLDVGDGHLVVHFAMRSVDIPIHDLLAVEVYDADTFDARFGGRHRVRIASLYGGLGRLHTRTDAFEAYITGHESLVVLFRQSGPPVLVSPADPHGLRARLTPAAASPDGARYAAG